MNNQHTHNFLTTAAQLSDALHMLDETHTAVIDHQIDTVNRGGRAELIGMLREIAYLAAETADELDQQTDEPALRLIKGSPRQAPQRGDTLPGRDKRDLALLAHTRTPIPFIDVKQAGG